MKTKLLKLSEIVTTAGTQIRAKIDADTVDQYAEAMQDTGNKFPPVVVFHDGSQFILADGFHRVMAASRNGFTDIEADLRKGTRADALRYALAANATHGLKRTNADKRRSVELALQEWPKLGDREISKICAVDHHTVASVRAEKESTGEIPQSKTRVGADGKERRMPKRTAKPEPNPEPEQHPPAPPEPGEDVAFEVPKEPSKPELKDEFKEKVERDFHRWMSRWAVADLPRVREALRSILNRSL